ncbi:MAG: radical SAM protein [Candidatus Jettenia caeni]|nr:radical SAM protein [Candidatus Jettenia caeni]
MHNFEYVVYSLTTRCNLDCLGCFRIGSNSSDTLPDTFLKILPILKELGCKYLNLSGGEPLLNPYCSDLISLCKKFDINPLLSTNGILLDNLDNNMLKGLKVLAIPLDGPNQSVNDEIRGSGHFAKVTSLISEYRSRDYPFILKVNTVVSVINHLYLDLILQFFSEDSRIIWKLFQISSRGNFNRFQRTGTIPTSKFLDIVRKLKENNAIKCRINYLCEEDALKYIIIDPEGNFYIPEGRNYSFIGNFRERNLVKKIINRNTSGNLFHEVVLGEKLNEKKF